jgi:hypothetical protein
LYNTLLTLFYYRKQVLAINVAIASPHCSEGQKSSALSSHKVIIVFLLLTGLLTVDSLEGSATSLAHTFKMSRHSGSSRHRSHHSRSTEENPEDLVEQVKTIITLLYEVVSSRPYEWEAYLPSARSAMTALDHIRFFRDPQRFAEQVWMLHGLQDYAFHDADSGCIRDIAEWCQAAWLRILRNYPENVETLTGTLSPETISRLSSQWC